MELAMKPTRWETSCSLGKKQVKNIAKKAQEIHTQILKLGILTLCHCLLLTNFPTLLETPKNINLLE